MTRLLGPMFFFIDALIICGLQALAWFIELFFSGVCGALVVCLVVFEPVCGCGYAVCLNPSVVVVI